MKTRARSGGSGTTDAARRALAALAAAAVTSVTPAAHADEPPKKPAGNASPSQEEPCEDGARFKADPLEDGALLSASLGFAGLSEAIISTGEIRPQQIDGTFDTNRLLPIDRAAITQTIDTTADAFSNGGLYLALGFAALDSVVTGIRGGRDAALVDFTIYSEAIAFSWGLTNLAKIGFRRPRPIAYIKREHAIMAGQDPATYNNRSTDSALSFYSGHTALTGAVSATATYLAFARSPNSMRAWATLAGGFTLTSFVAVERVRSGAHFPTDVIAGALAGAGIGMIVVHLHRYEDSRPPIWVGAVPTPGGGEVMVGGRF